MKVTDKDIFAFIGLMPPDMKQSAINGLEFLRGMTIADYKAKQIEAAELLVTDVQNNPDNYTTASLNNKIRETLGSFEISKDLAQRIELVKRFIGMKGIEVVNGTEYDRARAERQNKMTWNEYMESRQPK